MLENENHNQEQGTKKKIKNELLNRLSSLFFGSKNKRDGGENPKAEEKKIDPEIIQFNQEQIVLAVNKILEIAKKKPKKLGLVAQVELSLKNRDGEVLPSFMRYLVAGSTGGIYYHDETMAFRFELFAQKAPAPDSLTFVPQPSDFEHYKKEGVTPVAFRENYFADLESVDPEIDGLPLVGMSYTDWEFRGLGIATQLFTEVNSVLPVKDFVKRTKRFWEDYDLPEGISSVTCILTDATYRYGNSKVGWTTRLLEKMGLEEADRSKYPTSEKTKAYLQRISL
ncbi:MAG: hypothetical protein COU63_04890 [Candidatus Pacebacteria bacterium CG10_big_fil_rev_8_21_14_0_10_36_11]|nr:hypothetical protein [Candidatus Pacearchaeota archaeon]OIP73962.1 MAG: hypothetical protein AUK08_01725 [Candidatus Pacebacteria bacterium CG2_30_36_39]PIR64399.1 MAG: hypothetical protein COU63_04890 [Candidatus Pacebacteria bacterium CG10_big_fil_rev_8_21_14_0_10_36_11]PJC42790.1 MAG: hypothetical protein CO040_02655 [Candidatus Pacebacteria bacterium CG_4_9_14_0_2_um_filter_36_8]